MVTEAAGDELGELGICFARRLDMNTTKDTHLCKLHDKAGVMIWFKDIQS